MEKTPAALIKDIRSHLKLNQAEFAARIKMSYASVQRYEREGPPMENYGLFIDLAREIGREDLAGAFIAEIRERYGRFFALPKEDWTPTERHYCNILVDMLRSGQPEYNAGLKAFLDAWPVAKKQRSKRSGV